MFLTHDEVGFKDGSVGYEDSSHARIQVVVTVSGPVCRGHHKLLLLAIGQAKVGDLAVVAYLKGLVVHIQKADPLIFKIYELA